MAKDYFQSQEFKDILATYEGFRKRGKSVYLDAEDFADIADYYLTLDKPLLAMEAVRVGLSVHPDEEVLLVVQSAIYIYEQEYDQSEAVLKQLDASHSDVIYQLAQLQYAKYGNLTKAERLWRQWMEMESSSDVTDAQQRENYLHIISSLAELREEDDKASEEWDMRAVRKWIREYIDKFQPLGKYDEDVQLADICRESELADLMCEVLSQVLEEQPYLPKGWSNYALAQFIMKDYPHAIESCDFALAIDADDLDALLTKAHSLYSMGEKSTAKPVFKDYLDKGGDIVQVIPYAEALFHDGETEQAKQELDWLSETFENQRQESQARWESARVSKRGKELEDESEIYERFMELYQKIQTDIGDLYHHNECFEESIVAQNKVLTVDPRCTEAYFMLGINHLALQQYEDAARNFALALQWADDQVMMGLDIALTFALNHFEKFALDVLNAITQIADRSTSPYVKNIPAAKSLTYLKMGNADSFLQHFKEACKDTPELVQKVYEDFFPKNMPVSQWGDYAEREMDTLLKKFKKEDIYIGGFS